MNNEHSDDMLLKQVDDLVGRGKTSDSGVMNDLASTVPQADRDFQSQLEERLVAQLRVKAIQKKKDTLPDLRAITPTTRRPTPSFPLMRWVAVVIMVLAGGYLLTLYRQADPEMAIPLPIVPQSRTLVIATQNIRPGQAITGEMVGAITLSSEDFAELENSHPNREFFSDPAQAVGQMPLVALKAFEPLEPMVFARAKYTCPQRTTNCLLTPDNYLEIMFPPPQDLVQEMIPGDRVDVLESGLDGAYSVIVEDVLLVDEQKDLITLAAPSWKHTVLAWFSRQEKNYTLRLADDNHPAEPDDTLIDFTFESPEPLPPDYQFDLVVGFPESLGPLLVNLPYSIDDTPFTANGNTMSFWFKKLRMVSIMNQRTVVMQVSRSDAANLSALIALGASLGFQPDANPEPLLPENMSASALIPVGRVAIVLPVADVPPDADQMDVIMSLPESNISMSEEDRARIQDTAHFKINNGIWEFRFTDLVILRVNESGRIDPTVDETMVTFHATSQDAMAVQYLVEIGGQVQFVPKIDETLAESAVVATSVPENADLEICMELLECRRSLYHYKIKLPLSDFTVPYSVQQGERVDIARSVPAMTVEYVILLKVDDESVTVAAPAWKYSLLLWLLQLDGPASYTMNSSNGLSDGTVVEPMTPITMTLNTPDFVPEVFNLMLTIPEAQISRLADLPYYGLRSSFQNGVLTFSFPDIEMVSPNADSSYIIRLPAGDAANLDYLLSLGAEFDVYMESKYLPTPDASVFPTLTPMPVP